MKIGFKTCFHGDPADNIEHHAFVLAVGIDEFEWRIVRLTDKDDRIFCAQICQLLGGQVYGPRSGRKAAKKEGEVAEYTAKITAVYALVFAEYGHRLVIYSIFQCGRTELCSILNILLTAKKQPGDYLKKIIVPKDLPTGVVFLFYCLISSRS